MRATPGPLRRVVEGEVDELAVVVGHGQRVLLIVRIVLGEDS